MNPETPSWYCPVNCTSFITTPPLWFKKCFMSGLVNNSVWIRNSKFFRTNFTQHFWLPSCYCSRKLERGEMWTEFNKHVYNIQRQIPHQAMRKDISRQSQILYSPSQLFSCGPKNNDVWKSERAYRIRIWDLHSHLPGHTFVGILESSDSQDSQNFAFLFLNENQSPEYILSLKISVKHLPKHCEC